MIRYGVGLKEKTKAVFWAQKIYISEKEVGKISCNVGESRALQSCNVLDSDLLRKRIVNSRSGFVSMGNSNLIYMPYTL